jgi:hypothetical protein
VSQRRKTPNDYWVAGVNHRLSDVKKITTLERINGGGTLVKKFRDRVFLNNLTFLQCEYIHYSSELVAGRVDALFVFLCSAFIGLTRTEARISH